jgi:hypothetical protein
MKLLYYLLSACALAIPLNAKLDCEDAKKDIRASRFHSEDERIAALKRRTAAACLRIMKTAKNDPAHQNNGDERRVPHFAAQFSKGLEHDPKTGFLTKKGEESYKMLVKAASTGKQSLYNAIKMAPNSERKLVNPQGSATYSFEGGDSSTFVLEKFPELSSPEAAAQLIENYLLALARDVNFSDYGTGKGTDQDAQGQSITANAAKILQDLGAAYEGPRNKAGSVDSSVLFRGVNAGSLVGFYGSQFLYIPLLGLPASTFPAALGLANLNKTPFVQFDQMRPIASEKNFGIAFDDFIAIQNNTIPQPYETNDFDQTKKRFIIDGRDISTFVHFDFPYEASYNALNILFAHGFPLSPSNPYVNGSMPNEGGFVTLGFFDAFAMLGGVASEAAKAAWMQKWRVQRALRPEAFAGLVHVSKVSGTNPCKLNKSLFKPHAGIDLLEWVRAQNESDGASTYLLSQAYPEASPLHPSWPSGHATIAGACITVIKALFDDQALIKSVLTPVKPDPNNPTALIPLSNEGEDTITVGSELDKLASNVAIGRNFAGIHYRADADQGMALGEAVAIKYLQDRAACLSETTFKGFELTKLNGVRVRITAQYVFIIDF